MILSKNDKDLREFLRVFRYATTPQLAEIFFSGSLRYAQERLKKLTEYTKVHRYRREAGEPYIYTLGRKIHESVDHELRVVDAYVALKDRIIEFTPRIKRQFLYDNKKIEMIPDAFISLHGPKGKILVYLEVELQPARDSEYKRKVRQYEAYYLSKAYLHEPWGRQNTYPRIVIFTEPRYLSGYQEKVKKHAAIDLKWQYVTDIRDL